MSKNSVLYVLEDSGSVSIIKDGIFIPIEFVGLHFKRISAAEHSLWGIGADNQVYVYVNGRELPIAVTEEAYENERWNPKDGFCEKRLPSDRAHFSTEDGLSEKKLEAELLPSLAWQWESGWKVSTRLGSQPLGVEGWTYALDFPRTYTAEKAWNSYVRRRKWTRRRVYVAVDTWAPVQSLNNEFKLEEPIIDVAIGGGSGNLKERFCLSVWVVTITGRVAFRKGIGEFSPEGTHWITVPTPPGIEIAQISVGPTGRVWATTWNGQALVRTGIVPNIPEGADWLCVESPSLSSPLAHVSVGLNVVWATTRDWKVWYRKGIRSKSRGSGIASAGDAWCEMSGEMSVVSVSPDDQVFGIGGADRQVYFRTGVTPTEPYGKSWVYLIPKKSKGFTTSTKVDEIAPLEKSDIETRTDESLLPSLGEPQGEEKGDSPTSTSDDVTSSQYPMTQSDVFYDAVTDGPERSSSIGSSVDSTVVETPVLQPDDPVKEEEDRAIVLAKTSKVPPPIVLDAQENTLEMSKRDLSASSSSGFSEGGRLDFDSHWMWISAGACHLNWENLPVWCLNREEQIPIGPWRATILDSLRDRMRTSPLRFEEYENPVGRTSWVRKGRASWYLDGVWQGSTLELEWWNDKLGSFTVYSKSRRFHTSLPDVIYASVSGDLGRRRLCLYSFKLPKSPIRLSFSGDSEVEEWISYITYACLSSRSQVTKKFGKDVWALTSRGDIFVSATEAEGDETQQTYPTLAQGPTDLTIPESPLPLVLQLENGFSPGSVLSFAGTVPASSKRFSLNFECSQSGGRRDVAFHLNPRFMDNDYSLIRNTQAEGAWGEEEKDGDFMVRKGEDIALTVECLEDCFRVLLNKVEFCTFLHRLSPDRITQLGIYGGVIVKTVSYQGMKAKRKIRNTFFHQICGHLKKVESHRSGVIWGIGYDGTTWVHTGGYNGPFGTTPEGTSGQINEVTDTKMMEAYENQRWNPVAGFSSVGLPTDRSSWSDETGRIRLDKESMMLPSMHFQWTSEWVIDFGVRDGCDTEGWQYALDFPSSYHPEKGILDYVRRRRWIRKCKFSLEGPWMCQGFTQLLDVSIRPGPEDDEELPVWAVTASHDLVYRKGVTKENPVGTEWERVQTDHLVISASVGRRNNLWCVTKDGSPMLRGGMNKTCPLGRNWFYVETPNTGPLRKVSVGDDAVWALDNLNNLFVRKEIFPAFPEGTSWHLVDSNVLDVSLGPNNEVWAILMESSPHSSFNRTVLTRRVGVGKVNLAGASWDAGVGGDWTSLCARSSF